MSLTTQYTIIAGPTVARSQDLTFLASIAAAGQFTPFIDRRFTFDQMAEAHRYVDTGRKRGNVAVSLDEGSNFKRSA